MAELRYESPLKLPPGWVATPPSARLYNTAFPRSLTLGEALRLLDEEAHQFPFTAATVYTSIEHITNDRLRKRIGNEVGASLKFKCFGQEHFLACDLWQLTEHNLYALHLALRAIRNFEEWGLATRAYAFSLFATHPAAAPAASSSSHGEGLAPWMLELGLGPTATLEDANAIYRRRAKDLAGEEEALLRLNQVIEEARIHLQ